MKEKIKGFWKDNKEQVKTGTILVLIPIAVLGVIANTNLTRIVNVFNTGAEAYKRDLKE